MPKTIELDYAQLLETNELMRKWSDECYWLCTTRTVQESKLFPVPPYMWLAWLNSYYRYPSLVRKIEDHITAEECGDRARDASLKLSTLTTLGCLYGFYLFGREYLISLGVIKPEDGVEDAVYLGDFWKRFCLSYRRNDGHLINKDFGDRSQLLPERTLQVFEADAFEVKAGDSLHEAAVKLAANLAQYTFLSHCECRIGVHNSGPYKAGERELLVRDWYDLGEGDLPWLDGIADDIPFQNLTMPMFLKDTHVGIVDGWGSFESTPNYDASNIAAVGLYTSDVLSDGYIPVGMSSRTELEEVMVELSGKIEIATRRLWEVIAGWSRDEMMDAGALSYFSANKDLAHIAGIYDPADWFVIDERVQRLRPIFNDEYARDAMGEMLGYNSFPHQSVAEYTMARFSDAPRQMITTFPYSILSGEGDFARTLGEPWPGSTSLAPKTGRYTTSRGKVDLDELNRLCREFTPRAASEPYVWLDDEWVKFNHDTPLAADLYALAQDSSRTLAGQGAGLKRADIERIREEQGAVAS